MAGREVRIALIMGGGVSLGSFSGGALAEIVRLLEEHAAEREGGREKVQPKIDVVSGASAGAMSLAILIRYLMAGADHKKIAEAMRDGWVNGIGIDVPSGNGQLLPNLQKHEHPSLLSVVGIDELADRHLSHGTARSNPSSLIGDVVYASFAVANLHGLDVRAPYQLIRQRKPGVGTRGGRPTPYDDTLTTTFFDDQVRFAIKTTGRRLRQIQVDPDTHCIRMRGLGDPSDAADPWSVFRKAATASGAFPGAFPPRTIQRSKEEYGELWPRDLRDQDHFDFAYMDGGVFRNEPLREAIDLAAIADAGRAPDGFERVYIVVDPNISGSQSVRALDHDHVLALQSEWDEDGKPGEQRLERRGYAGLLLSVLGRTAGVVKGQAAFRDWLRVAQTNTRLEWQARLLDLLRDLAVAASGHDEIRAEAAKLLRGIYEEKVRREAWWTREEAASEQAEKERERDLGDLGREIGDLLQAAPEEAQDLALVLALALKNVAGLNRKRRLNMVAITPWSAPEGSGLPRPVPLAGNFLANFGGFFRREWREHDFQVGQWMAHHVLPAPIPEPGSAVRPLVRSSAPSPVAGGLPRLAQDPSFRDVDDDVQERFFNAVHNHVENVLHAIGIPDGADNLGAWLLKRKVRGALRAPSGSARHVILAIDGSVDDEHFLVPGPTGERATPVQENGKRVLETIVEVREDADRSGNGRYTLGGPHVLRQGGSALEVRIMQDRRLRSDPVRLTIRLGGSGRQWFDKARSQRLLHVRWNGRTRTMSVNPDDLTSLPLPLPLP